MPKPISSKIYGDAMLSNESDQQDARPVLYANCRVRTEVGEATVDTYFGPNKTIRELRELIKIGAGIDPLKDFSEAAREEAQAFTSR
jgi:hypothetical protein